MKKQLSIFKKISIMFVLAVMLASFVSTAQATLMTEDLSAPGDGLLTLDTSTGLDWLNLTLTKGVSYNDVFSGFNGFTTIFGFSYATVAEVGQLISDAGVVQGNIWGYWDFSNPYYLASYSLANQLGITYPFDGLSTYAIGVTGMTNSQGTHELAVIGYNNHADSISFQDVGSTGDSSSNISYGSFLVRDSAPLPSTIPEPSQILLFGAGLAGLLGTRLRSKNLFVQRCNT